MMTSNLGLVKGLNEVVKCLDRKEALICILASNCEDGKYKKLVSALCKQNKIPLVEVDDRMAVGEWLGLCKFDKDNKPRKIRGASSVAIKDYGEETEALHYLQNNFINKE
mmetsp:Transcript_1758/g.1544  ORF Transcript_1758/g.1544 Transcript_1758/m.1544 type:complete len:110 (-) Transcript_1758:31-360(-)